MCIITEGNNVNLTGKKSADGKVSQWRLLTWETVNRLYKQLYAKNELYIRSQDIKKSS